MPTTRRTFLIASATAAGALIGSRAQPASARGRTGASGRAELSLGNLDADARSALRTIAHDTWKFFGDDVDPTTHLPYDNVTYAGGSATPTGVGHYTSAANIGVYLWSVVAARDLGLISDGEAVLQARNLLSSVKKLQRHKGFLYQWYDTNNGSVLLNPGQADVPQPGGTFDNGSFLSCVDNGWYVSGLVIARQAIPQVRGLINQLMLDVDFSIFYDDRAETVCNVNPAIPGNQPTGQMYGGYYVGSPPDEGNNWQHYYHSGALYSDPRISAYLGMGLRQMPGNVWWRSWRMLPPPAPFPSCTTDPDFSWQGQWPLPDNWITVHDPVSGGSFPVFESHYTYPGTDLRFIPTWGGGMFEALMANVVVPETSWGPHSFGLADKRTVEVQRKYATEELQLPVWGMSPSSTPDDSGGYATYGVEGLRFPYYGGGATAQNPNLGLSQCHGCASEDVVAPHASFLALDPAPQAAVANIDAIMSRFPQVYGSRGFFDALNPTTGAVGHRMLVLDQSMILASLANALNNRSMQRYFANDPVSWAARAVLSYEHMTI